MKSAIIDLTASINQMRKRNSPENETLIRKVTLPSNSFWRQTDRYTHRRAHAQKRARRVSVDVGPNDTLAGPVLNPFCSRTKILDPTFHIREVGIR